MGDYLRKKGRPVGENNRDKYLKVRLNEKENELLEEIADDLGINKSELVRECIRAGCLKHKYKW